MSEYKHVKGLEHLKILNTSKNRFYAKVKIPNENGCMLWSACLHPTGYGMFGYDNRMRFAHRYSYKLHFGEIPKGMHVLHKCDNPRCVAPDHLFLGTQTDNNLDMYKKGRCRGGKGENNPKSKLNKTKVKNIRTKLFQGVKVSILAEKYNVCIDTIYNIKKNKIWKDIK